MKKQIGSITISSGFFYVVDPCYIKGYPSLHIEGVEKVYEKFFGEQYDSMFGGVIGRLPNGTYQVFAHYDDDEDMKGAIEKLEIQITIGSNLKRVELGRIGVDAGIIYFVDPSKVKDNPLIYDEKRWQVFVNAYYNTKTAKKENFAQMCDGIICNTYSGDGEYPVYGFFDEKKLISKIEIDFKWEYEE